NPSAYHAQSTENQVIDTQSEDDISKIPRLQRQNQPIFVPAPVDMQEFWQCHNDITPELILKAQAEDGILNIVRKWVIQNKLPLRTADITGNKALNAYYKHFSTLTIHEETGVLCKIQYPRHPTSNGDNRQLKICLPITLMISIFFQAHRHPMAGHLGREKTLDTIQRYYYFPGIFDWVTALLADCIECQKTRVPPKAQRTAPVQDWSIMVPHANHTIHIDYKGPFNPRSLGNKYCLVIVDAYTHFVQIIPTPTADATSTINALRRHWIPIFGIPRYIVHDQG
ncbi:MAG: hypothetical protein GY816_23570, partial [Cytophagales bacterium]|nr:hypothetical protein [Cytophagales bacterium]